MLNNFKLMAKNLQKRNKLDDSATLNFYQICVSDGSCLCEACMFMKHITCVNLTETHILCFIAICIHAITGSLQHITFSSWVYYKVNIGPIYPLELMFTKVV